LISTVAAQPPLPRIVLRVCDSTAYPNQEEVIISVMLDNYIDTIAAFSLWIQMDRPDLLLFQTAVGLSVDTSYWECLEWADAVCIDSTPVPVNGPWDFYHVDTTEVFRGLVDTTGTLISEWEYVDTRLLSGMGTDMKIVGIANLPDPPFTEWIFPQQGATLIKLLGTALDVPDTVQDRTVNLMVIPGNGEHTGFSTPDGTMIGITYIPIIDTTCFLCTVWCGEECCSWQQVSLVPPGGCDSMVIAPDSTLVFDSNAVVIIDGSVTILMPWVCGDINSDGYNGFNIADLTFLVNYLFRGGPAPLNLNTADCNGDGAIDVADITCWVCYLFLGCPAPTCQ